MSQNHFWVLKVIDFQLPATKKLQFVVFQGQSQPSTFRFASVTFGLYMCAKIK